MRLIDADALLEKENIKEVTVGARHSGKTVFGACKTYLHFAIEAAPTIDAVPVGVLDQVRWERDVAIAQLNDYGVSFGEKADCVKVVRCRDCKHRLEGTKQCACPMAIGWDALETEDDDFCSRGERRSE